MEIIKDISTNVAAIGLIISSMAVIERFCKKSISNLFLRPFKDKLDAIEQAIRTVDNKVDKNEQDNLRCKIVNFANDLKNGEPKSEVQYTNICDTIDKYINVLHGNTYAEKEAEYIHKILSER